MKKSISYVLGAACALGLLLFAGCFNHASGTDDTSADPIVNTWVGEEIKAASNNGGGTGYSYTVEELCSPEWTFSADGIGSYCQYFTRVEATGTGDYESIINEEGSSYTVWSKLTVGTLVGGQKFTYTKTDSEIVITITSMYDDEEGVWIDLDKDSQPSITAGYGIANDVLTLTLTIDGETAETPYTLKK